MTVPTAVQTPLRPPLTAPLAVHRSRFTARWMLVLAAHDGGGLPAGFSLPRDAGTGLGNIWSRLEHLYGGAASLTVRAGERAGTIVELLLPA